MAAPSLGPELLYFTRHLPWIALSLALILVCRFLAILVLLYKSMTLVRANRSYAGYHVCAGYTCAG